MSFAHSAGLQSLATVILAAGKGTRMKSDLHKVLHPIGGKPMLHHLLDSVRAMRAEHTVLVVGAGRDQVEASVASADAGGPVIAEQAEQLGTGHAVMMAREALKGFSGDVLVLYGDVPLIPTDIMEEMVSVQRSSPEIGLTLLGFIPQNPARYGRLITGIDGSVERIVEYKDASPSERAIDLCNSGMMVIDGARLFTWLDLLENSNAAGEYYLTDLVALARADGAKIGLVTADETDVLGVNSRADLAAAEAAFQARVRARVMAQGATLIDPASVYLSADTEIGRDVLVEPNVFFGPGVRIEDDVTIKGFSHLEGAHIAKGASVGPYARLRPGSRIGAGAKIGNFVETKNATIAAGAKASHLSYIGDASVGAGANIGAGTITCNYDGYLKHQTLIGENAFIGSNSALVAPVEIGARAIVGAGSTITKNVAEGALTATRAPQKNRDGAADRLHERGRAAKAARTAAKQEKMKQNGDA